MVQIISSCYQLSQIHYTVKYRIVILFYPFPRLKINCEERERLGQSSLQLQAIWILISKAYSLSLARNVV